MVTDKSAAAKAVEAVAKAPSLAKLSPPVKPMTPRKVPIPTISHQRRKI